MQKFYYFFFDEIYLNFNTYLNNLQGILSQTLYKKNFIFIKLYN